MDAYQKYVQYICSVSGNSGPYGRKQLRVLFDMPANLRHGISYN